MIWRESFPPSTEGTKNWKWCQKKSGGSGPMSWIVSMKVSPLDKRVENSQEGPMCFPPSFGSGHQKKGDDWWCGRFWNLCCYLGIPQEGKDERISAPRKMGAEDLLVGGLCWAQIFQTGSPILFYWGCTGWKTTLYILSKALYMSNLMAIKHFLTFFVFQSMEEFVDEDGIILYIPARV